jgi:muconolactone delta-isomerase
MSKDEVSLREHIEALRVADQRALNIKAEADKDALILAREIQTYKDQQHNGTLDQLNQERGEYVTINLYNQRHDELEKKLVEIDKHMAENTGYFASKEEVISVSKNLETLIKPLTDFVASQQGRSGAAIDTRIIIFGVLTLIVSFIGVITAIAAALIIALR